MFINPCYHSSAFGPTAATESHELRLHLICTPAETITTGVSPMRSGSFIEWEALSQEALQQMPVLQELREVRGEDA